MRDLTKEREMINSHEIANILLSKPAATVEIVTNVDGEYVETKTIASEHNIWEFMGNIRIQPVSMDDSVLVK